MKKYVKLISALFVLVMMLAQVVCLHAASVQPSVSYSTKQIDHFEKTCTVTLKNVKDVKHVWIASYKSDKTTCIEKAKHEINGEPSSVEVYLNVRPTDAQYIHCTIHMDDGTTIDKWYNVGGNSYYNPGSASTSKEDYYTGLRGGSSSSSSNGTIVEGYYDPYNRYYEDKKEEIPEYEYYYVTCRKLNVRNGAGTWADKVGSLKRYDKVKVYDIKSNDWAVIEYAGHLRFVSAKYLAKK